MPKDIIFAEERKPNLVREHLRLHSSLEHMKSKIRNAATVQNAVQTLLAEFGRDDLLGIVQAVREVFQTSNENIGRYL